MFKYVSWHFAPSYRLPADQVSQLAVDNKSNRVSIEGHLKPSSSLWFTLAAALAIGKFVIVQCLNESKWAQMDAEKTQQTQYN